MRRKMSDVFSQMKPSDSTLKPNESNSYTCKPESFPLLTSCNLYSSHNTVRVKNLEDKLRIMLGYLFLEE